MAMVGGDAAGFLVGEMHHRSPAGLLLEIDVSQRHASATLDDEAGVRFLHGPRRREAALRDRHPGQVDRRLGNEYFKQAATNNRAPAPKAETRKPSSSAVKTSKPSRYTT